VKILILVCVVLTQCQRVMDRRMDGQLTDRRVTTCEIHIGLSPSDTKYLARDAVKVLNLFRFSRLY